MEKKTEDGKKLSYDEVEVIAEAAADKAMKAAAAEGGGKWLVAYMNTKHKVFSDYGYEMIYD